MGNVTFSASGMVFFNGEYWTAQASELGLFTFGSTPEEAASRMDKAVALWANTLIKRNMLQKRLEALGVPYNVSFGKKPKMPHVMNYSEFAGAGASEARPQILASVLKWEGKASFARAK